MMSTVECSPPSMHIMHSCCAALWPTYTTECFPSFPTSWCLLSPLSFPYFPTTWCLPSPLNVTLHFLHHDVSYHDWMFPLFSYIMMPPVTTEYFPYFPTTSCLLSPWMFPSFLTTWCLLSPLNVSLHFLHHDVSYHHWVFPLISYNMMSPITTEDFPSFLCGRTIKFTNSSR